MSSNKKPVVVAFNRGFTLIELLVISPIIILFIAGFIGLVVTMVGSVLSQTASSTLTYNIQDALNRMEADIKQSGAVLAVNNLTIQSPQGYNNDTTNFVNAYNSSTSTPNSNYNTGDPSDPSGAMLILNAYATTTNPVNLSVLTPIPASNEPNSCGSGTSSLIQNTLVYINVVYFVRNNSLFRRVVVPSNYPGIGCYAPWQQASCASGYTNTTVCKTNDIDLVDGITTGGFSVNYYPTASSTTANTVVTNPSNSDSVRGGSTGMLAINTVGITITASKTVAGRTITASGSIRATSVNDDTSSTATGAAPVIATNPTSQSVANGATATFSATASPATGATYQWQQSPDGGTTWTNISGATSTSLSFTASASMNGNQYRIVVSDSVGTTTSSSATLTVSSTGWTTCALQNGWTDYGNLTNLLSTNGYRMTTTSNIVVLKGTIQRPGTPVANEIICTLPYNYRPAENLVFQTTQVTTANPAFIGINTDGTVRYLGGTSFSTGLSLDGINYLPASAGNSWTSLSLTSPFVYTGSPYAVPAVTVDTANVAHLKGSVKSGTTGTITTTLPTAEKPNGDLFFVSDGSGAFDDIAVRNAASISPGISGSSTYQSIQAMYEPASFSSWTTFTPSASWVNYGSTYANAEYTKTGDNMVIFQGLIKSGTVTAGQIITVLPAGDRPLQTEMFPTASNNAAASLEVLANGDVETLNSVNNTWLSLAPIQFYAEQ